MKTADASSDLIGNKIADAVAKSYAVAQLYNEDKIIGMVLRSNPEIALQRDEKPIAIPRERYISLEKRQ